MLSRILSLLFFAAVATPVVAIETVVRRCDGCTFIQKRSFAQSLPVASEANVYFMDFSSGALSGFHVYRSAQPFRVPSTGDEGGDNYGSSAQSRSSNAVVSGDQLWLESLSITPEQQLVFSEFVDSYYGFIEYSAQTSATIGMPNDGNFDSIHDISGCPACARNWLLSNSHRVSNMVGLFDILHAKGLELSASIGGDAGSIGATYSAYLEFKLAMESDVGANGEAGYCMATLAGSGMVIDTSNCTDSDGNPIPVSADNFRNMRYMFLTQKNLSRWLQRAQFYGIPITGGSGGNVTVGGMRRFDCNQTECIRHGDDETDPQ